MEAEGTCGGLRSAAFDGTVFRGPPRRRLGGRGLNVADGACGGIRRVGHEPPNRVPDRSAIPAGVSGERGPATLRDALSVNDRETSEACGRVAIRCDGACLAACLL